MTSQSNEQDSARDVEAQHSAKPGRSAAARRSGISVELEVPFHDVDSLRVVWHGHYYKYLEIARSLLLRDRGFDRPDLHYDGYHLLVVDSQCRYTYPLRYRDRFRVDAWFTETEQRLAVAYEIVNLTAERRAARARTMLVTVDADGKMLYETPRWLRERLETPGGASDRSET